MGNSQTMKAAQEAVEAVLAANDDALFGIAGGIYGPQLMCRRGRPSGYVWQETSRVQPISSGN